MKDETNRINCRARDERRPKELVASKEACCKRSLHTLSRSQSQHISRRAGFLLAAVRRLGGDEAFRLLSTGTGRAEGEEARGRRKGLEVFNGIVDSVCTVGLGCGERGVHGAARYDGVHAQEREADGGLEGDYQRACTDVPPRMGAGTAVRGVLYRRGGRASSCVSFVPRRTVVGGGRGWKGVSGQWVRQGTR